MTIRLTDLKGIGEKSAEKLNKLKIFTVEELAGFLPKSYIDMDSVSRLDEAEDGVFVLVEAEIIYASKPFRKGKLSVFSARGKLDDGKKIKLVFYNISYVSTQITIGKRIRCYGKLSVDNGYVLVNPSYELLDDTKESKFSGIKPIYATRGVIPQATFLHTIEDMLIKYNPTSILDDETQKKFKLMSLNLALHGAHRPKIMDEIYPCRERMMQEELVKRITAFKLVREMSYRDRVYKKSLDDIRELIKSLPYELTASQNDAVSSIITSLKSNKPLNSMLVGDVGSGKTIVAVVSAYFAVLSGYQVVIMAPTELLAKQHYNTFQKFLSGFRVKITLLTGSTSATEKREIKSGIKAGYYDIVIGTHALFSDGVDYKNLALVIVDEQHRFGVAQRTAIIDKGKSIDLLTLSATPIPRSLRLTMFGDIEVLNIERRYDQDHIITAVVGQNKRKAMLDYIVEECKKGNQAYIVAPKIVDSEGMDSGSVDALFAELTKNYGDEVEIALLHGKMSAKDKITALDRFATGKVSILVSTTVIEVGIDVPNASLMVIFGSDRFGLASLHQLRGRIGRNGKRSYCFLYTEKDATELVRLQTMVEEKDGFKIAEKDYEIRGAGDFLGESQSGRDAITLTPSIHSIKIAKELSTYVDIEKHRQTLEKYIEDFNLSKITLS